MYTLLSCKISVSSLRTVFWHHVLTAAGSRPTYKLSAEHAIVQTPQWVVIVTRPVIIFSCTAAHVENTVVQEQSGRRVGYDVILGTNSWQRQNICCRPSCPDGLSGTPNLVADRYPCAFSLTVVGGWGGGGVGRRHVKRSCVEGRSKECVQLFFRFTMYVNGVTLT
jgi:hypothetical protein